MSDIKHAEEDDAFVQEYPVLIGDPKQSARARKSSGNVVLICLLYMLVTGVLFAKGLSHLFEWFTPSNVTKGTCVRQQTLKEQVQIGDARWFKCGEDAPENVECGTIIVPLNYFNLSEGTAEIFMGRIKATKSPKQGSIMLNPGGPGGSGYSLINRLSDDLPELLGHDYDLIGFDPRGIGQTKPRVQCFPHALDKILLESNTVLEQGFSAPSNLSDPAARAHLVAQNREFLALKQTEARMCAEHMGPELAYMGTANVVRDMEFMTRVLDGEDARINYWGGSYGTILGAYLVNMLPDRVRRVVIDGVANPVLWAEKPSQYWHADWIHDTEATYQLFLHECAKADADVCPLQAFGKTASEIEHAIDTFLDELYAHPLSVPDARRPGFLSAGAVRALLLKYMQAPTVWPTGAANLADAMHGNGTGLLNALLPQYTDGPGMKDMARLAVTCLDSPPPASEDEFPTAEGLADIQMQTLHEVSARFGASASISEPDQGCQFWPVRGPERFEGPWNHTLEHPMLIVSNTLDPITPLKSGRLINKLMGSSSRLLIQNGPGHCSLAMTSLCTARTVRAYFANGTLPENEAHCDVDNALFPTAATGTAMTLASKNDERLSTALASASEKMSAWRMDAVLGR